MSIEKTIFPIETDLYKITKPIIPDIPKLSEYYQFSTFLDNEFAKRLVETNLSIKDRKKLLESGRRILEESNFNMEIESRTKSCYIFKKLNNNHTLRTWLLDSTIAYRENTYKNRKSFSLELLQRDYDILSKDSTIKREKTIEYVSYGVNNINQADTIIKLWKNWIEMAQNEL